MNRDARVYIECRYDGDTADVVAVVFRDRGILPIEVETVEFTSKSHELGEDVWHEVTMTLYYALEAIQAKRV
jgi:hypothetical protein